MMMKHIMLLNNIIINITVSLCIVYWPPNLGQQRAKPHTHVRMHEHTQALTCHLNLSLEPAI